MPRFRIPAAIIAALSVLLLVAACRERAERSTQAAGADGSTQTRLDYVDAPAVTPTAAPSPAAPPAAPEALLARQSKVREEAAADAANTAAAVGGVTGGGAAGFTAQSIGGPQLLNTAANAMIIRTGQVTIEVTALDSAVARVRQIATSLGGYVANSSFSGGEQQIRSATLELKVPAARFDGAIGMLRGVGEVEGESVHAQDVGEEFVDVTARVANARRLESRLIEVLANRTGRLQDVLAVERELARVREEIERYEGRLRYLQARTAVSTLAVTVHEPPPVLANSPGRNPIGEAFRDAWRNFVAFTAAGIAAMGIVIPLVLIGAVLWALWRRYAPPVRVREVREEGAH